MVNISDVEGIVDINDPAVACSLKTLAFCHGIFVLERYKKYTSTPGQEMGLTVLLRLAESRFKVLSGASFPATKSIKKKEAGKPAPTQPLRHRNLLWWFHFSVFCFWNH